MRWLTCDRSKSSGRGRPVENYLDLEAAVTAHRQIMNRGHNG